MSETKNDKARFSDTPFLLVALAGFSFWFLIAVPFASHRESYAWLASVYRGDLDGAVGLTSKTWRPLAQAPVWLEFVALDPRIFPTSVLRQTLFQGVVYLLFVLGWGVLYYAVPERRTFAIVAFTAGAVFFSGYIHLFHLYGLFYVPLMLMLAVMVRYSFVPGFKNREIVLGLIATALVLWHPFATVLFLGFYFGRYFKDFTSLRRGAHVRAWAILLTSSAATLLAIAVSPNLGESWAYDPRSAFIISYRTNEVHVLAAVVAWILAYAALWSMEIAVRTRIAVAVGITLAGACFLIFNVPLLLLWMLVVIGKLLHRRLWTLFWATIVAVLLPYGGRIGGPIYALFPIILAVVVTSLGWTGAESRLRLLDRKYPVAFVSALVVIVVAMRVGVPVPVVSTFAKPLLAERERTFQLEHALAWLAKSKYCAHDIVFAQASGSPIDDVKSAIDRRYRPPSDLQDVTPFWRAALQCVPDERAGRTRGIATVTFGGQELTSGTRVLDLSGRYAGPVTVWVQSH
jgi:hypothetical protein